MIWQLKGIKNKKEKLMNFSVGLYVLRDFVRQKVMMTTDAVRNSRRPTSLLVRGLLQEPTPETRSAYVSRITDSILTTLGNSPASLQRRGHKTTTKRSIKRVSSRPKSTGKRGRVLETDYQRRTNA